MDALKTNFTRIFKREPTEAEFSYLVELVNGMGIDGNDEMLLIFLSIQKMVSDGQMGTANLLKNNSAAIEKASDAKVREFGERIKELFAVGVKEHKRIQGETVQTLVNALQASKAAHTQFINELDKKIEKSLFSRVGDVLKNAAQSAVTRANWFFIGSTISIVTALFFGCLIYATYQAYNFGRDASALARYEPGVAEKILHCDWPGWEIVEEDGQLICKPGLPEDGPQGWRLPR